MAICKACDPLARFVLAPHPRSLLKALRLVGLPLRLGLLERVAQVVGLAIQARQGLRAGRRRGAGRGLSWLVSSSVVES